MAVLHNDRQLTDLAEIRDRLRALGSTTDAQFLQRFFKTASGEYAAGDRFIGVRVPATRKLAAACADLPLPQLRTLLRSKFHEERLLALILLVRAFARGDDDVRRSIYDLYLANTRHVNNWDLVDASAPHIVGAWLQDRSRAQLYRLCRSKVLWERRIAILATLHFIRNGEASDTLRIAASLLGDEHDLIHKATGWMLREVGQRVGKKHLLEFLDAHATLMPRTMLRYAVERLPTSQRRRYLRA
ncbi:MAG: DNA alkylation repair protein [Steroidobacteraceae bacterium]